MSERHTIIIETNGAAFDDAPATEIARNLRRFDCGAFHHSTYSGDFLMMFLNEYECPCGCEWSDTWSCACNDKCPECGKEIEPTESAEIDE